MKYCNLLTNERGHSRELTDWSMDQTSQAGKSDRSSSKAADQRVLQMFLKFQLDINPWRWMHNLRVSQGLINIPVSTDKNSHNLYNTELTSDKA